MQMLFVVTDEEGAVSCSAETLDPETFSTFKQAKACAEELAAHAPGKTIRIYQLAAETVVAVSSPHTTHAF